MEIERQFLIDTLPPLPTEYDAIRQGYVSLLPEIRIRQTGDGKFTLTVKRGAGLVREEWETEISQQEFESLAQRLMPSTRMIEKRRYRLPLPDGRTAEIHVHEKHLAGFSYAEVNLIMLTMPPISNRRLGSDGKSRRTSGSLMGLWLGKTAWKLYGGFWENNHKLFCRNEGNLIFV